MFCRNCGKELKENELFCTNCGAKVKESVSAEEKSRISKNQILAVVIGVLVVMIVILAFVLFFGKSGKQEDSELQGNEETTAEEYEKSIDAEAASVSKNYYMEQEESGLKMTDTMTLKAEGDTIQRIREVIELDVSAFSSEDREKLIEAYDDMVEQYNAVDGVRCTKSIDGSIYTIKVSINTTGDAVEQLEAQGLLEITGDAGGKLSLKATSEALESGGYELVE